MDKIALISDIHGNMVALETVLADIHARGITEIYNLGDLVGKGARSDLAIDRSREICQVVLRGNWDDSMLAPDLSDSSQWYRDQIGPERLGYLDSLPGVYDFLLSGKRVRLYHASQEGVYTRVHPWNPYATLQAMFYNTEFTGFDNPEPDLVGYGDIHGAYMLAFEHKTLFNAGSVGNPLDIPLATYVVMSGNLGSPDPAPYSIDFVRLPYDIDAAVEEARAVGVPHLEAYIVELRTAVYRGRQRGG